MSNERKSLMAAAGAVGDAPNVADVFSVDVWDNVGSSHTINSGLDSTDSDVMIWAKQRDGTGDHFVADTVRGITKYVRPNNGNGESTNSSVFASTSSTGYTVSSILGGSTQSYVGWQFKKKKKFFDIVTWTGNSTAGRQISHSLEGPVGMIMVKRTNGSGTWRVYHRSASYTLRTGYYNTYNAGRTVYDLSSTSAPNSGASSWNNTDATDTHFTLANNVSVNTTNNTYVAYVFADNSSEDAEEQMIKCGYYFGNANANGPIVNLGWEPQWLLIRPSSTNNWLIYDNIRGVPNASSSYNSGKSQELWPNLNSEEDWDGNNANKIEFNATGFQIKSASATHNKTSDDKGHLYMAIRAPMMKEPEAATDVFALDYAGANGDGKEPNYRSTFPVDFALHVKTGNGGPQAYSRVTGPMYLYTDSSNDEGETSQSTWDFTNGWWNQNSNQSTSNGQTAGLWKRAKGFFDVVAYTGNATARVIPHSLGVVPEMIWVKKRSAAKHWSVWHKDLTSTSEFLSLNNNWADTGNSNIWNNGVDHTSTTFSIHTTGYVNSANSTYISYHFASLAGISKVGSFTGNGTGQNIDCGFSNGAKWVLLKNISATHGWHLFDTTRGIVTGNDPYKLLNTNASQYTNVDMIDPYESGFAVTDHGEINGNGNTIIFYAIA